MWAGARPLSSEHGGYVVPMDTTSLPLLVPTLALVAWLMLPTRQ